MIKNFFVSDGNKHFIDSFQTKMPRSAVLLLFYQFLIPNSNAKFYLVGMVLQIKKFRDALAKHTTDRCSIAPTKGLEEKELLALSANRDLNFSYTPKPVESVPVPAEPMFLSEPVPEPSHTPNKEAISAKTLLFPESSEEKTLVTSGR